jgi:hypothetical protein
VDGAVTDYTKPLHDPTGVGYVKQEYEVRDGRGNVTVSEEWVLEADAKPAEAPAEDAEVAEEPVAAEA